MITDSEYWDRRYAEQPERVPEACQLLRDFAHLLPASGHAVDVASGLGGNALLLARHGLTTTALDFSQVALDRLRANADAEGLKIDCLLTDVEHNPPRADLYDVIVVSHFLHRPSLPLLSQALKRGGLLFYQTFTNERVGGEFGPSDTDYLLRPQELLQVFSRLHAPVHVHFYREEALVGDLDKGLRNLAQMIARKSA